MLGGYSIGLAWGLKEKNALQALSKGHYIQEDPDSWWLYRWAAAAHGDSVNGGDVSSSCSSFG